MVNIFNPYNTYKCKGLPPGPICNPGAKSIDAVLYPQITNNLFFVSKGNGTHYFSSTFEEHVRNKLESRKNLQSKVDEQTEVQTERLKDITTVENLESENDNDKTIISN